MTTEEKRMKLLVQCASNPCTKKCPLYTAGIKCGEGTSFLKKNGEKYDMPDKTIEKAYDLMFGEKKPVRKEVKQEVKKESQPTMTVHACPFASGIICGDTESKCASCGWNPAVAAKRKARLKHLFETPAKKGLRYLRLKPKG